MTVPPDMPTEMPTILIVEDDLRLRESLVMVLGHEQYKILESETGETALELLAGSEGNAIDLIVLDVNLPGIDGMETCRQLRAAQHTQPVLMLTARHEIADRVAGLDAGADDYLPKPFALEELLARVRSMLRRAEPVESPDAASAPMAQLDDLTIDGQSRIVQRGAERIELTKIEFDLLELLVENRDIVLTRELIQDRIWGYDDSLGSNSLEVFISTLRKKTEVNNSSRLIHTIRGVGYVARTSS